MTRSRPPLVRMQHIDRELRNNRYPNCCGIAGYFDVSRNSIQHDIGFMRDMLKAPIDYDRQRKGYFYTKAWEFDLTALLDEQESEAIAAAAEVLCHFRGTPCYDEVNRAIGKLVDELPFSFTREGIFDIYSFNHPAAASVNHAALSLLEQDIRYRRKVRLIYRSASTHALAERIVRPYRLHYDQSAGTWYLIAFCEKFQATRIFDVNRIQHLSRTTGNFTVPSLFSVSNYIDKAFHQAIGIVPYDIAVRFTPYQAQWIRQRRWHHSQKIEEHDDGSLTLRLTVTVLEAVKRWVMRFGAQAEVLQPTELRDMIRQEVNEMGMVYRNRRRK
jgi:predicted DNA-binding transcriptional regulator YafY